MKILSFFVIGLALLLLTLSLSFAESKKPTRVLPFGSGGATFFIPRGESGSIEMTCDGDKCVLNTSKDPNYNSPTKLKIEKQVRDLERKIRVMQPM